jgi:hypothetical protein
MKWAQWAFVLLLMGLFSATFASIPRTDAHGLGNQQLEQVEAGPYLVTVWTDPKEPTTDKELHVTISVQDRAKDFVLNADVQVVASLDTNTENRETATHEKAVQKLFYEAPMRLETVGTWDISVTVESELGVGEVGFDLAVEEGKNDFTRWLWPGLGVAGVIIVAGIGAFRLTKMRKERGS